MRTPPLSIAWLCALGACSGLLAQETRQQALVGEPARARELLALLTEEPRLAGTQGSRRAAENVAGLLRAAGIEAQIEEREVYLSLPRRLGFTAWASSAAGAPLIARVEHFDADAERPGLIPKFSGWTKSAKLRARVVDVGRGLREDYQRLARANVDVRGAIALASYGGAYRGIKVDMAAEYGCAGVLLYSDTHDDGAAKGPTWPEGPWKPGWDAQRGSISPMGRAPGDPSTPGFGSPAKGERGAAARLAPEAFAADLPRLPCLPIGWDDAAVLRAHLAGGAPAGASAAPGDASAPSAPQALGPGPVEVELDIDAPIALRSIYNVIGRIPASGEGAALVMAGNHRDSWGAGAHDAGSGTVALLLAAERLGARVQSGWKSASEIRLCFWDAEEQGLIGSTEYVEGHLAELEARCAVYVNADTMVSGLHFGAGGTPGLLGALKRVLAALPDPEQPARDLWQQWVGESGHEPSLGLPGSGSDFAGFLHHAGVPVLDLGLHGNSGGQYHTSFDTLPMVERYLDPGFRGHACAGALLETLLVELARQGFGCFDSGEAASELARQSRLIGLERAEGGQAWIDSAACERLAGAFERLAQRARAPGAAERPPLHFYAAFLSESGLPGRPWFRNLLWTPGLENGYSSESFPTLRAAAPRGGEALERELAALVARIDGLLPAAERASGQ